VNCRAVLDVGVVSIVVDGRDRCHEFWNVDGVIVGIRLKKGGFLDFVGSNGGRVTD
jgi:hypothetical protein